MNKNTRTYKRQRASDNAMFPSSSMPFLLSIQPLPPPSPLSSTLWFCLPPTGQKALTTLIVMSVQGSKGVGGGAEGPSNWNAYFCECNKTHMCFQSTRLSPPSTPVPVPVPVPRLVPHSHNFSAVGK